MKQSLVLTLIGKDRRGLVEMLARIVDEHGGNWEESRMVRLAGEFAGMLHVQLASDRAGELEAALGRIEGLSVVAARGLEDPGGGGATRLLSLEIVGQDHPGIIHGITSAIAARGINIEELESGVVSAPMSGERLFEARAQLRAPADVTLEDLERALEELAADLMVEARVGEPENS